MSRTVQRILAAALAVVLVGMVWWLVDRASQPAPGAEDVTVAEETTQETEVLPVAVEDTERDRQIFQEKMDWARSERLDTLPIGEIMVRLGRTFVGTPYTPGTLEIEGPERLVINLRELDCVTYVETVLAMSRLIEAGIYDDYEAYKRELLRIRYRDGELDGYPSRLHYFSEWIANGEEKGLVRNVTRELGGIPDREPVNFMSTHTDAYPKLADPRNVEAIREVEAEVSELPRYTIPEDRIAQAAPGIRNGDIIAATSTVEGLDVAHTGIAIWLNGELHLMHAPLVGKSVEISEQPLAQRIQRITGQDGIMVARPL